MRNDLQKVLKDLQASRLIQSIDIDTSKDLGVDPILMDLRSRLERINDLLSPLEPTLKGLKAVLGGKNNLFREPTGDIKIHAEKWVASTLRRTGPLESSLKRIEEDIDQITELMSRLTSLSGLDVDLYTISSFRRVRIRIGTTRQFDELKRTVEGIGGDIQASLLDRKEGLHSVRITYSRSQEGRMSEALRGRIFTEMNIDVDRFKDILKRNNADLDILNLNVERLIPRIETFRSNLESRYGEIRSSGSDLALHILPVCRAYLELVELELERTSLGSSMKKTRYTCRLTGWIEKDRMNELLDILTTRCRERFHVDHRSPILEEIEDNQVPTKLNNGWLGSMFEPLTTTFAVPKYNEIDPSLWISVPFILFFGLMLGDAGYGILIMLITSLIILLSKGNKTIRMTGWMGFLMGLSTTIAGIWMGAFFGDLIPRVFLGSPGSPLFTFVLFGYELPYDTLKDPMLLFQISLYIGLLQLNLGILLYGIDKLVKRDVFGFFKGTISWVLIQVGGVIFVGALLIGWWELDPLLSMIGGGSFVIGTILLAFDAKGMVLFNIEGFVGDWISYTRILALGLSTFGLAMAFNIVGRMLSEGGAIMIPIVFILLVFLHVFNLLLQALGAAVHSLRLQFVEFFGRFFEGGGKAFEPFGMERFYTGQPQSCLGPGGDDGVC